MKIVLLSFTPRSWTGGVNRWVNDFIRGFPEAVHYSWFDVLPSVEGKDDNSIPEWDKANVLSMWLHTTKKISRDDIIIGDGFWGTGLVELGYKNVISVSHGIWSHLTSEDVEQGKLPEFPYHHAAQVKFRKEHVKKGGRLVAVSDFIATEMRKQWGFSSYVINNAIDLTQYRPVLPWLYRDDHATPDGRAPLIIHGVNDKGNENKGWKHIELLKERIPYAEILSLDEAHVRYSDGHYSKADVLSQADLVVIPSGYEGNSYFCLETLACNVPVVAYNVGLMYRAWGSKDSLNLGLILDRNNRSPQVTVNGVKAFLADPWKTSPRDWVSRYSIEKFHEEWRDYLSREFKYDSSQS